MDSLLDQSALTKLAERLVAAARRAGADAADAIATRGVSQSIEVREGSVEESERSEGDNIGLRVLVGQQQAVVSTNDISGDGIDALAQRAVAMAKVAPPDKFAGLADPSQLAKAFPDLDLLDPVLPTVADLEAKARAAEAAGTRGQGRHQIRRRVGVGRHRRHGAGDQHRLQPRLSRLAARRLDAGDRRRRHRHGARLRLFRRRSTPSDLDAPEKIGTSAGERAVKRLNPRKVTTRKVPVVFDPRVAGSLVGHLSSAINGASIARGTSFLKDKLGEKIFADGITIIDDPLRKRGLRSHPFDAEGVAGKARALDRGRRADDLDPRLRDRARTQHDHHRPCAPAACRRRRRPARPICILRAGTDYADSS